MLCPVRAWPKELGQAGVSHARLLKTEGGGHTFLREPRDGDGDGLPSSDFGTAMLLVLATATVVVCCCSPGPRLLLMPSSTGAALAGVGLTLSNAPMTSTTALESFWSLVLPGLPSFDEPLPMANVVPRAGQSAPSLRSGGIGGGIGGGGGGDGGGDGGGGGGG